MTAASSLIERAEALGAAFELKDGSVKVRATRPLPADLMAELRQLKAQVIEHLRQRDAQGVPDGPTDQGSESRGPQGPAAAASGLSESEKRRAEFEQMRQIVAAQGAVDEPPRTPLPYPAKAAGVRNSSMTFASKRHGQIHLFPIRQS